MLTVEFELFGQRYIAINSGNEFKFNESVSFMINCEDQAEIDYYWEQLTKDGGEESVCGWLKDKYGLSWQVTPTNWEQMMNNPDGTVNTKAFQAMMKMKKIIIKDIENA